MQTKDGRSRASGTDIPPVFLRSRASDPLLRNERKTMTAPVIQIMWSHRLLLLGVAEAMGRIASSSRKVDAVRRPSRSGQPGI
jgi:hypothetical protein